MAERSDSGTATATFRADAGGTMIWSTAWNGFVSGALRYLASATLQFTRQGGQASATIAFDTRRRLQVRP